MTTVLDITAEPTGTTYTALLHFAARTCTSFSLVWQDDSWGPDTELALRQSLLREQRCNAWPGTTHLGQAFSKVRYYRLNTFTLETLSTVNGLYSWLSPDRPEDLAIYAHDGSIWLASIAHEHDAWLELDHDTELRLRAQLPELRLAPRVDAAQAFTT